MPTTPPASGPARSAAELNEQIRAFWLGPGGHPAVGLTAEQRAEYHRLCMALLDAERMERGSVVEAA
jgi:hypothetical protein